MTTATSRYLLRPMTLDDIPRIVEIERESFPTMWPQTAYKRELQQNKLAAYLVASALPDLNHDAEPSPMPEGAPVSELGDGSLGTWPPPGLTGLVQRVRRHLHKEPSVEADAPPGGESIVGFVGLWFMVNDAHIVTIAVAEAERRRGIGELLLIAAIELSQRRDQDSVTLECRVGNTVAQALYEKYAFERTGLRKRYYTDNNEDALIMTTPPIQSEAYRERFERLRAEHRAQHGIAHNKHPELQ